ncbi:hypothetical protein DEJ49_33135 [Streptomyces venezuelae]|uniref:Uncharacterized protein n=1 Tax=Streptomyces venezuelae TaxID=54571 RepID=A0A5P2CT60_STRVZ|nr:hypothetical protein [Streptomyces venezuelae]QES45187.1 hypothetical protein DEJ49_33135 [Streptomyces venezuelae]
MTDTQLNCFDMNCSFTGPPLQYAEHLYSEHTEDSPGVDRWDVVERLLWSGARGAASGQSIPAPAVRNDCAFCHRERSAKDDNHAPECPYWDFFGPAD